jgi:hypothetical protein
VPAIKFWVDGLETVDESDARPLTGAEQAELERQEHVSKWVKRVERLTGAAAALSACMALFAGNRVIRHRYDLAVVACVLLALAARFLASRLR